MLSYYLSMTCALLHQLQSQPSLGTREDIGNGILRYDRGDQGNLNGLALLVSHAHPSHNDGGSTRRIASYDQACNTNTLLRSVCERVVRGEFGPYGVRSVSFYIPYRV